MRVTMKWSSGVVFCLLALPGANADAAPPQARDPELSVLHILIVADTNANIGTSVGIDRDHMTSVLKNGITDEKKLDLKTLDGDNATPDKILGYFKDLKSSIKSDEAVAFFYAGHGATFDGDHTLTLDAGKLKRKDLLDAMKATNAPLVVCLTDCCATQVKGGRVVLTQDSPADNPVIHNLFLQARGVIDITAATLDASMGDDQNGGFFTRSLTKCLRTDSKELAGPGDDGFVTWTAFFDKVSQETAKVCQDYVNKERGATPPRTPAVDKQIPFAWSLGSASTVTIIPMSGTKYRLGMRVHNNNGDGVRVGQVLDGTAAKRAGFEVGDVVLSIDSKTIKAEEDYAACIDACTTGHIKVVVRDVRTKKAGPAVDVSLDPIPK